MATPTDSELLDYTKDAIRAILLGGQSYTIAGKTFTRAQLPELRKMRADLEARARRASGTTSNTTHAEFGDAEGGTSPGWNTRR